MDTKNSVFRLRLTEQELADLKKIAKARQVSASAVIREWIKKAKAYQEGKG